MAAVYAWILGSPARSLGVLATALGRYDLAEAHFEVALETNEHIRAPYWTARTQLEFAEMLHERGASSDLSRADALVQRARQVAHKRGYQGLLA
ncbi:MAG: hypothetical protein HKN26_04425, partial [Acidimicrobiales bacterium]|nr:hypothetical protein [Acidimicrobiales bacterium]